jgi:hypothetical protein
VAHAGHIKKKPAADRIEDSGDVLREGSGDVLREGSGDVWREGSGDVRREAKSRESAYEPAPPGGGGCCGVEQVLAKEADGVPGRRAAAPWPEDPPARVLAGIWPATL